MSDIIVISNSSICKEDFLLRIEKLAKAKPKAIVLREKHLPENDYEDLAKKVIEICNKYNTQCILHNFPKVAEKLNHNALHLPLQVLATLTDKEKSQYKILGASCHSVVPILQQVIFLILIARKVCRVEDLIFLKQFAVVYQYRYMQ